jgi:serine/threonine-protein kinase RsbW
MAGPDTDRAVHLTFPAETRFLRLARLTAAGLAGDLGFGIEDIEDLRIAVDEACAVLLDAAASDGDGLELVYRVEGTTLVVEGACDGGGEGEVEVHPVAREILRMSADEYSLDASGGRWRFRLVKRGAITP